MLKSLVAKKKCFSLSAFLFLLFLLMPANTFGYSIRTGAYLTNQSPIGEAFDYFTNAFGGGIAAEFDNTRYFGESLRIQGAGLMPKDECLESAWQFSQYIGIWYLIPFEQSGFAFQPSVELGLMFQGAKTKEGYGTLPQKAYTDFSFQFSPSFRYKNENILSNKLEIEMTPTFTLIVQKTGGLAFLGLRIGALYILDL